MMNPSAVTRKKTTAGGSMSEKAAIEKVETLLGVPQKCKNLKCGVSTGICGSTTCGSGKLDPNGYWEYPCTACERYYNYLNI